MADDELSDVYPRLRMFFANRGGRDHSSDLASEVVTRVLAAQASGRGIESLTGFALGTARIVWLEFLRGKQAAPTGLDVDPEAPPPAAEADPEDVRCLKRCLLHLPPESRRLFMTYVAGPGKNKDRRARLAGDLGVNANALQQRVSALRLTLRRCLEACAAGVVLRHAPDGELP
jgi:DNA-directed RNA polymerase specialized sigma24 family protein